MRVTSIDLYSAKGDLTAEMSLNDPSTSKSYVIKGAFGLDADEVQSSFEGKGLVSGKSFYSHSLPKKQIVLRIFLNPDYAQGESPSSLRDHLYRVISSARTGILEVRFKEDEDYVATISGFVTKFEAPHTSEVPEVQITIDCDDGVIRGVTPIVLSTGQLGITTNAGVSSFTITDDVSTAPHGMAFVFTVTSGFQVLEIRDDSEDWKFELDLPVSAPFQTGDEIHIGNLYNDKHAYLIRSGQTIQIGDKVSWGSQWPTMFPGANSLEFEEGDKLTLNSVTHSHAFWGV